MTRDGRFSAGNPSSPDIHRCSWYQFWDSEFTPLYGKTGRESHNAPLVSGSTARELHLLCHFLHVARGDSPAVARTILGVSESESAVSNIRRNAMLGPC